MAIVLIQISYETSPFVPVLAGAGHRVIEALTIHEVLEHISTQQPDIVVIPDIIEPVNGGEFVYVLRQMTAAPIIVVGAGGQERLARTLFQGADAYLTHPVEPGELRSRLRALLRRQSERRRAQD